MNKEIYLREQEDGIINAQFYKEEINSPYQGILNKIKLEVYSLGETDKIILDIGAATAQLADVFKKDGKKFIALDFVYDCARIAREYQPDLIYVVASAHRLPFKDGFFDAVIADGILHHLKVQGILPDSLNEISRILKKKGKLCVYDRNGGFLSNMLLIFFIWLKKILLLIKGNYPSSSTRNEVSLDKYDLRLIEENGFKKVSARNVASLPFYLAVVFSNFLGYLFNYSIAGKIRNRFFPFVSWFEDKVKIRSLTVEQCIKFEKYI